MEIRMHTLLHPILLFCLTLGFSNASLAQGDGTVGGLLPSPFRIERENEKFWNSQSRNAQKKLIALKQDIQSDILAIVNKNKVKCLHYNNEDFESLEHFYMRFNQIVKNQENIAKVTHPDKLTNNDFCKNATAEMANCIFSGWNSKRKLKKIVNNEHFSTFVEYSLPIDHSRPENLKVQERKDQAAKITAFYQELAHAK